MRNVGGSEGPSAPCPRVSVSNITSDPPCDPANPPASARDTRRSGMPLVAPEISGTNVGPLGSRRKGHNSQSSFRIGTVPHRKKFGPGHSWIRRVNNASRSGLQFSVSHCGSTKTIRASSLPTFATFLLNSEKRVRPQPQRTPHRGHTPGLSKSITSLRPEEG